MLDAPKQAGAQQHTLLLSPDLRDKLKETETSPLPSSRQQANQLGKQGSETTLQHDHSFLNMPRSH